MRDQISVTWRLLGLSAVLLFGVAPACAKLQPDADEAAAQQTQDRMREAQAQVGMAKVVNFTELKFANMIAELRDQSIRTWSYTVDMEGRRHLLCESVGYGLPYGVQTTNPQRVAVDRTSTALTLPRPTQG